MLKTLLLLLLSFIKPVNHRSDHTTKIQAKHLLKTGWYYVVDEKNGYLRQSDKSKEQYYIDPNPIVTIKHFSKIEMDVTNYKQAANPNILVFRFDDVGTKAWSIATDKAIDKRLALIIDDQLIFAPKVYNQITSGISTLNTGTYTKAELEEFEKKMKAEM